MEVRDFRERSRKAMIDRQKSVYPEGYPNRMSDFFSVTLKLVDVNDSRYETLLKAYVDWALVYCDYASVLCLPEDVEGLYNKSFELAIPLWELMHDICWDNHEYASAKELLVGSKKY